MPSFNIQDFAVNSELRYFSGSTEITKNDFVEQEVAQLSTINADGIKERANVRFSESLVSAVNNALKDKELKTASLFKL